MYFKITVSKNLKNEELIPVDEDARCHVWREFLIDLLKC